MADCLMCGRESILGLGDCNQTHLSQSDRFIIERMLMAGHSFKEIAANINRHPSTISREIRTNRNFITTRVNLSNDCALSSMCTVRNLCNKAYCSQRCCRCDKLICREYCNKYQQVNCLKLNCKPYVCNICKQRTTCKRTHAYYNAHVAHKTY